MVLYWAGASGRRSCTGAWPTASTRSLSGTTERSTIDSSSSRSCAGGHLSESVPLCWYGKHSEVPGPWLAY